MTGINLPQLRALVIGPALDAIGLGGDAAEELILGTIIQESGGGRSLRQLGGGPALGIAEMEPGTHDDIWLSFLNYRPGLAAKVAALRIPGLDSAAQLAGNLYYAVAMARIRYFRSPLPLPPAGDIEAQAAMWKGVYNTASGAGTEAEYRSNWIAAQK